MLGRMSTIRRRLVIKLLDVTVIQMIEILDAFMNMERESDISSELDLYLNEKPSKRNEGFDILKF